MKKYIFIASGLSYNLDVALRLRREEALMPSVWVGDPVLNAQAGEFFPGATVLDMDQIWRNVGYPPAIGASEFEVLAEYWSSPTFKAQRPQLMQELNRRPLPHTVREVDKEVVIRGLLSAVAPSILHSQADFLLASETPHNPINLSIFFLAKWLDIPTLFFQPTTAVAPALLPRTDLGDVYPLGVATGEVPQTPGSNKKMSLARSSLDDLGSGAGTMRQRENLRVAGAHSRVAASSWHLVSRTLRGLHPSLRDGSQFQRENAWLTGMQSFFKKELANSYRSLQDETTLDTFALFALHYQPERTIVPESGYGVFSQQDLILQARQFVPTSIPLVVREHKSQSLANNPGYLGRSALFYRWVESLPNTHMLSGEGGSRPLLERASVVFTSTGTVGIEASMVGIRAVHFGFPWWQGAPGTARFSTLESWEQLFSVRTAGGSEVRRFLSDVIARRTIFGFGTPSQLKFWSKDAIEKKQSESDAVEELVAIVAKFANSL